MINKKEIEKIMDDLFDKLSKETQDYLMSEDYVNSIVSIENKFNLSNEETLIIQSRTLYFILKMIDNTDFKEDVILALRNRSAAEAEKIIKEIEEKILIHK